MTPRLANDQHPNAIPTMWDNLVQVASLAGRVDSGYSFAHAFGYAPCSRIARRLGTPEDGS